MRNIFFVLIIFILFLLFSLAVASRADAQGYPAVHRCTGCGKILGREVPESELSGDPDFKKAGTFQICEHCMKRRFSGMALENYVNVAKKYKRSTIEHNRKLEPKTKTYGREGRRKD